MLKLFLSIFIFWTHSIFANVYGETDVQIGAFIASQGKSQHINIESLVGDDFNVTEASDYNFLVGFGYYFKGLSLPKLSLLYGLNAFYLAPTKVKGDVTQENLYTNLSYQYTITNCPVYAASKLAVHLTNCFDLLFDLGLGLNVISTSSFKESSLDGGRTIPDSYLFAGAHTTVFSVFAGTSWKIHTPLKHLSFEIAYRFFYLGEGKLKNMNPQLLSTFKTGNSYANSILLSICI